MAKTALSLFLALLFSGIKFSNTYSSTDPKRDKFEYGEFPAGFLWGASTSAYQVEGGWNIDGKGPSLWDSLVHNKNLSALFQGKTGDVACDSYHKYKEDVQMLKKLGVKVYRFSLSWPRILPQGTKTPVNPAGIDYYNNLINELIKHNIEPIVTLYHFDLPLSFVKIRGWMNKSMVDYFNDYATICFENFGDRVKKWITINEPLILSLHLQKLVILNPNIPPVTLSTEQYRVAHNLILGHAKVYHTYKVNFKAKQKGQVAIALNGEWAEPLTDSQADRDAADRAMQFSLGFYAEPIFGSGDYPDIVKRLIANKSAAVGIPSRLPVFTEAEKAMVRGSSDFLAANHYFSNLASNKNYYNGSQTPQTLETDGDVKLSIDPTWNKTGHGYEHDWPVVPWGFRRFLAYIKDHYGNPDVYVTENGCVVPGEAAMSEKARLQDDFRINFLSRYINEAFKAYKLDGVNLKGYMVWSLMDNFEWMMAYSKPFGIYYVNFSDPKRPRKAKKSVSFYSELIEDNGFQEPVSSGAAAQTEL